MEIQKKKCSFKEHEEINANFYCGECKVYMCNKCEIFHSKLLQKHQIFNIDKDIGEIFTGICKEENHQMKLEYFCRNHNQLCCAGCIAKIKKEKNGIHNDCDVCIIEEIKDEKKNKIKENIKYLENLSKNLEQSINTLNNIFEKIKNNKEELKMKIQKIFTTIRNELNNREDTLLLKVDSLYDNIYFNDSIIKDAEKLPNKIKLSLEKVKSIEEEENKNELSLFINNCINIEKNIKDINIINENIKKYNNSLSIKINFIEEEKDEKINEFLNYIKNFGNLEKTERNGFKEIENPWTNEMFHNKVFYYTLKEKSYTAEKTKENNYIHLIKSSHKFEEDKIYKLEFIPNYEKGGDIFIGFADFKQSRNHSWLKDNFNCVGLSHEGLYINGKNINSNLKVQNKKKYEYIIDVYNKSFILNIDGIKAGEFKFNFKENIYAHAGIRSIGNSITIKTYEKQ